MEYQFRNPELESVFVPRQSKQPGRPIEEDWKPTSKWSRRFFSKNIDLAVFAAAYMAAIFGALAIAIRYRADLPNNAFELILGAAGFGVLAELVRRIYDTAVKRLAVTDLFTSEMFSILRTFVAGNIIGKLTLLYDMADKEAHAAAGMKAETRSAAALARPAGSENYFSIFETSSSDLGLLDPAVINDITAFYTFLKAARDATGALKSWTDEPYTAAMKKEDIVNIVYLCFLMTLQGRLALGRLIVSKDNFRLVEDILAGVLLQCFVLLNFAIPPGDFRRDKIVERRKMCAELRKDYNYQFGPEMPVEENKAAADPTFPPAKHPRHDDRRAALA